MIAKPRCLAQEGPRFPGRRGAPRGSQVRDPTPHGAGAAAPHARPRDRPGAAAGWGSAAALRPPPHRAAHAWGSRRPHPEGGGVGDEGELEAEVGEPPAVPHLLRVPRRHPPAPQHLPPPAASLLPALPAPPSPPLPGGPCPGEGAAGRVRGRPGRRFRERDRPGGPRGGLRGRVPGGGTAHGGETRITRGQTSGAKGKAPKRSRLRLRLCFFFFFSLQFPLQMPSCRGVARSGLAPQLETSEENTSLLKQPPKAAAGAQNNTRIRNLCNCH